MKKEKETNLKTGILVQAVGPIVDVRFADSSLPPLLTALKVNIGDEELILEVEQHIGDDTARCVAMGPTDGVFRGMEVINT